MATSYKSITRSIEPVLDKDFKVIGYDGFLDGQRRVYCAATYLAADVTLDDLAFDAVVALNDAMSDEDARLDAAARQWSASLCKACYAVHDIQRCPAMTARLMEETK